MSEQDDNATSSPSSAAERATQAADRAAENDGGNEDDVAEEGEDGAGDGSGHENGGAASESLSEVARRPSEDIETALSGILEDGPDDEGGHEGDGDRIEDSLEGIADEMPVDEDLAATIREADPETTARAIQLLRLELDRAEEAVERHRERADDLESRLKRKQADFQNYKKRQKKRKQEEIERATEDLVSRLLDVRDNLQRALDHDDADIRGGVESTLRQFDSELERENVDAIEPGPGDAVDPQRHEVLATVASDQPADTIAERHRPGYEMAGKVLRPAQVAVSDGSKHDDDESGATTDI